MLINDFDFSGEIVYIKNLDRGYCKSVIIKGVSNVFDSLSSQTVELKCLIPDRLSKDAGRINLYDWLSVSGHIEMWSKPCGNGTVRQKIMFIVDYILDIKKQRKGGKSYGLSC
ncbi:hypothetical protein [uncultured Treponema sp.]|uniref:hypothetical protein n=1 Tax=uncultured Treponema sp. TaxID=162155 RepID=UPI002594943E|nr:hypothetical protein [uncultured Treponema sp.]